MTKFNYMITFSAGALNDLLRWIEMHFQTAPRRRARRARDIDPCGPGQVKNNEIQRLCQAKMSAES